MKRERELDHEVLKAVLRYDEKTGELIWRLRLASNCNPGSVAGVIASNGYRYIAVGNSKFLAHRLVWFYVNAVWPECFLDHVNRDRADNRIENLREATPTQNAMNSTVLRKTNKSGYRGVSWVKAKKKWRASGSENGHPRFLGYFDDPKEAAECYQKHARQQYGEFVVEVKDD